MGTTVTSGAVSVAPMGVMSLRYTRPSRTLVHIVLDREDPDITLRPSSPRTGSLEYLCADEDAARALENLHAVAPGVLVLASDRAHLDGLRYVVVDSLGVELDARTRRRWLVTVPFQEVYA